MLQYISITVIFHRYFETWLFMFRANLLPQIQALDMTEYLNKEKEYVPWITALSSIAYIGDLLLHRPGYKYYEVSAS